MIIASSVKELADALSDSPFIATMGFFDGVHAGHQILIDRLTEKAKSLGVKSVILALDRPWIAAVKPDLPHPKLLSSLRNKIRLIASGPGDILFLIPFTKDVAVQDAEAFLTPLLEIGMKGMVLGYDNRFGQAENTLPLPLFDRLLASLGLSVERIAQYAIDGIPVSSSAIRSLISNGAFEEAERLLSRPFSIIGDVNAGRQIGRTINYPTANIVPIEPDIILPDDGVFVSEVRVEDQVYPSMSYYGSSPTVAGSGGPRRIEAYLFGFHDNLYGKQAEIAFRHRLRDDKKFSSLEELKSQLRLDEQAARNFFRTHPLLLSQTNDFSGI